MLDRATRTTATAIEHTLDLATLARATNAAECDRVEVIAWTWRVALASGVVEIGTESLFAFRARFRDGATELCDP